MHLEEGYGQYIIKCLNIKLWGVAIHNHDLIKPNKAYAFRSVHECIPVLNTDERNFYDQILFRFC